MLRKQLSDLQQELEHSSLTHGNAAHSVVDLKVVPHLLCIMNARPKAYYQSVMAIDT